MAFDDGMVSEGTFWNFSITTNWLLTSLILIICFCLKKYYKLMIWIVANKYESVFKLTPRNIVIWIELLMKHVGSDTNTFLLHINTNEMNRKKPFHCPLFFPVHLLSYHYFAIDKYFCLIEFYLYNTTSEKE